MLDRDGQDHPGVKVRLFASVREMAGRGEVLIRLDGTRLSAEKLRERVFAMYPELVSKQVPFVLAVNHTVVIDESKVFITQGDEVAILPPISGG
ncbi:MAG: MoaD/ThiS family protein [Nitrososphaera sp.]